MEEPAEGWRPEPGDSLIGTVEGYSQRPTKFQASVWVAEIRRESDSKLIDVWFFWRVLLAEFQRHRPKVGDRIGIRYVGVHQDGYKIFRLIVDCPPGEAPDFAVLGGEDQQQPARRAPAPPGETPKPPKAPAWRPPAAGAASSERDDYELSDADVPW